MSDRLIQYMFILGHCGTYIRYVYRPRCRMLCHSHVLYALPMLKNESIKYAFELDSSCSGSKVNFFKWRRRPFWIWAPSKKTPAYFRGAEFLIFLIKGL